MCGLRMFRMLIELRRMMTRIMMIRQVDKSQTAPDKIVSMATCSRAGVRLLGLAAPPRLSELIFMFLCIVKLCHDDRCQLGL